MIIRGIELSNNNEKKFSDIGDKRAMVNKGTTGGKKRRSKRRKNS